MAESDVLEGELIPGLQAGDDGEKANIEHLFMLYSRSRNRNGDKADGIFGRDREIRVTFTLLFRKKSIPIGQVIFDPTSRPTKKLLVNFAEILRK